MLRILLKFYNTSLLIVFFLSTITVFFFIMSLLPPQKYSVLVYREESNRPFVSLLFILPILVTYEIGWRVINIDCEMPTVNGADAILKRLFQACGVYGSALSAIAVILALLFLHLHARKPWRFHFLTLPAMVVESIIIAIPVFFLEKAVNAISLLSSGVSNSASNLVHSAIYSLGAGVYEEFLFRFLLLGLILLIGTKIKSGKQTFFWLGVLVSAILFSGFHHIGQHGETWDLRVFFFRSIVGIYFAWIYTARGFGLAVGCHTAYDLMIVLLRINNA